MKAGDDSFQDLPRAAVDLVRGRFIAPGLGFSRYTGYTGHTGYTFVYFGR